MWGAVFGYRSSLCSSGSRSAAFLCWYRLNILLSADSHVTHMLTHTYYVNRAAHMCRIIWFADFSIRCFFHLHPNVSLFALQTWTHLHCFHWADCVIDAHVSIISFFTLLTCTHRNTEPGVQQKSVSVPTGAVYTNVGLMHLKTTMRLFMDHKGVCRFPY